MTHAFFLPVHTGLFASVLRRSTCKTSFILVNKGYQRESQKHSKKNFWALEEDVQVPPTESTLWPSCMWMDGHLSPSVHKKIMCAYIQNAINPGAVMCSACLWLDQQNFLSSLHSLHLLAYFARHLAEIRRVDHSFGFLESAGICSKDARACLRMLVKRNPIEQRSCPLSFTPLSWCGPHHHQSMQADSHCRDTHHCSTVWPQPPIWEVSTNLENF